MLTFEKVDQQFIISGIKYKIEEHTTYYNRTFIGTFNKYEDNIMLWNNVNFILDLLS